MKSLYLYYVANFILGMLCAVKSMVVYTHLMEFMPGRESFASGLTFGFQAISSLVSPLLLLYVIKNAQVLCWIALAMDILLVAAILIFYIPESSKYLLTRGNID